MSIILKILIGLVLLLVLVAVVIATSVFVVVLSHERRWRKCLSDDYKMYSDARGCPSVKRFIAELRDKSAIGNYIKNNN